MKRRESREHRLACTLYAITVYAVLIGCLAYRFLNENEPVAEDTLPARAPVTYGEVHRH